MRKFYCRENGHDPWVIIKNEFAQEAAEQFGAEQELENDAIVYVKNHGAFKLEVVKQEPEYSARKI